MTNAPTPSASRRLEADGGFYEEIEHTADLALRCGGPDLAALFRSAALGMYRLMGAQEAVPPSGATDRVSLAAPDTESLLVDWLGELAYRAEARGQIFRDITFEALTATRLEAVLRGGAAERLETVIKAVTYHGLEVTETRQGYAATVVFDV